MRLISETNDKKQPVIIVDPKETRAGYQLAKNLRQKEDVDVVVTKEVPARLEHFFLIYTINCEFQEGWQKSVGKSSNLLMIFIDQPKHARDLAKKLTGENIKHIKVLSLYDDFLDEQALERVFWFSFISKDDERLLEIVVHEKPDHSDHYEGKKVRMRRRFKRHYILGAFLTLAVYSVITLIVLVSASLVYLKSFTGPNDSTTGSRKTAHVLNSIGSILYRPVRPAFLFFSLGLLPDTLSEMNTQLDSLSATYTTLQETTTTIANGVFIKGKNPSQKAELSRQIDLLETEITKTLELSSSLEQKIPHWSSVTEAVRSTITSKKDTLSKLQGVPPVLESILARRGHKKYLVLIADTDSVKPGGGILHYYGILHFDDMNIASFALIDSAAVDAARTTPIEATSTYSAISGQPEFTLQNALTSADLSTNYRQVTDLLANETNVKDFDGTLLLTDTGIQQLISAYSPIYLSDVKETVTPENYSIKYQIAKDKKAFLSDVFTQLQARGERQPSPSLVPTILEALNEKQIVFLTESEAAKQVFDTLYWDGTVPTPHCLVQSFQCIDDYIFPVQSNIGDNPVNRYIEKSISQHVFIDPTGKISNTFTMTLHNTSFPQIYPGGTYKSYMQLILPSGASVGKVTLNGVLVEKPEIVNSTYTIVGFPYEIQAQSTKVMKIEYDLSDTLPRAKSIYQLIFQKQIGSSNTDVSLQITLPRQATITNKNFSPVVKNGRIFYNTVLNADKLFILEIDNTH